MKSGKQYFGGLFLFGIVTLFATSVVAQATGDASEGEASAGASETITQPPKIRISKQDCRRLIRHVPSADVAYQPGVDVRGNPVVPADAGGAFVLALPDVFEFNVTKDLSAYLDGPEEAQAASEAAQIAAVRNEEATDAAVSSAALSLAGAQTISDNAAASLTAAEAAANAAPDNETLAAALTAAQSAADTAASGLATTQAAYNATVSAAQSSNVTNALSASQSALSAAQEIGYVQNAAAETASETATTRATEYSTAQTAAVRAAETVAKSPDMTLNIGTVRYNINSGAMTFNGQPLTDPAEAALADQCRLMMQGK